MQRLIKLAVAFLFFFQSTKAQNYEKIILDTTDKLYGNYIAIKPQGKIQGAMVLLPGFGGNAEGILPETKLHNVASVNDVLTIVVNTPQKLYVDSAVSKGLNKIMVDVIERFGVNPGKFIIGGHSAGGTLSLRYAELCNQYPQQYPIQPQGIFSVDGPVDLIDCYHYFEREIKRNFAPPGVDEATYVKGLMDKELGPLKDNLDKYTALTPFYVDGDSVGNERYLQHIPVRVYHDVDIVWALQNRHRGVRDMNVYASSELISRLIQQGNDKAEFMPGRPGYRSNGMHHPHSWSIVGEEELVQWVRKTLQFFPEHAPEQYNLPAKGWNAEKSKFPLGFAPSIPYKGMDDIRFMPGFYDSKSEEFWSYCYLWYLDGGVPFTEVQLQKDLTAYYNGLNQQASGTAVAVKKIKAANGYEASFECTITTMDKFVTQKLITLHVTVHSKKCTQANKTIVFFEVSPQPANGTVWQKLNTVRDGVACEKN